MPRPMSLQGVMPDVFHCNEPEVLVSGPRGTSKTYTDMMRTLALCELYPGSRHLFSRFVRVHMNETVLETWERLLGPGHPALAGPTKEHRSSYQIGQSTVVVKGLDDPIATNSGEYDTITLFEATDIPEQTYNNLFGTLRHKKMIASDGKPWHQMRVECNPTYPHHWLKKRADAGRMVHFPTTHKDNPAYWDPIGQRWTDEGQNYISGLQRMTGVIYERNYLGKWVGAEGMIYDEWSDANIIDTMPPGSEDWWRVRSIDFGLREPFVCLWAAIDPNGRIYIEREYVKCNKTVSRIAPDLKRLTPNEGLVQFTVADHDAENRMTLAEHDIDTVPAIKPRKDGDWAAHFDPIKRRLMPAADGFPRLFVLRDALQRGGGREPLLGNKPCGLIEEIPGYQWEEPKPDKASRERPAQVNDHSCDSLRYLVLGVDRWFDGEAEKDRPAYEEGTIGEALGLNDEEDDA